MDEKKMLNDEELGEVAGGAGTFQHTISFTISNYKDMSSSDLRRVVSLYFLEVYSGPPWVEKYITESDMAFLQNYMNSAQNRLKVDWEPGWMTPKYTVL